MTTASHETRRRPLTRVDGGECRRIRAQFPDRESPLPVVSEKSKTLHYDARRRPPTPVYGGEDSPASLSGLAGAEHLQGGWDPTSSQHGLPSWEKPWDSMANAPAHVPVPVRARGFALSSRRRTIGFPGDRRSG